MLFYISMKMQKNNLFKKYTLQEALDELDAIESFAVPGHRLQFGEITNQQKNLYAKFGVDPPQSLQ